MLSKTTRLQRTENGLTQAQHQSHLSYYQALRERLQAVLEELLREKKAIQERFSRERQTWLDQLQQKDARIQKLELKIRQQQKENEQIRYQYQQRVSLMNILKEQNWLISKQYAEEKDRMKETLEVLLRENEELKEAATKRYSRSFYQQKQSARAFNSPRRTKDYAKPQHFYSMTHLKSQRVLSTYQNRDKIQISKYHESSNQPSIMDNSVTSMAQQLKRRESEFKNSRITQVKGGGSRSKFFGLKKMSTITHLTRQKTCGNCSND